MSDRLIGKMSDRYDYRVLLEEIDQLKSEIAALRVENERLQSKIDEFIYVENHGETEGVQ